MERMVSYAQNYEDVYLRRVFENLRDGFYVDIGSGDSYYLSVTKYFYDRGWSGINVDPLLSSYDSFAEKRPRDLNLNVAIGRNSCIREFYEVQSYPELSTFSLKAAETLIDVGYKVKKTSINVITGTELFEKYCTNKTVDFLKIDVEGAEKEIIESFNFQKNRPRILIIESTIPNARFPGWLEFEKIQNSFNWEEIIISASYIKVLFDGLNTYFVRKEDEFLSHYFKVPICHWDNFELAVSRDRITELQWHCDERMKQIIELTDKLKRKII